MAQRRGHTCYTWFGLRWRRKKSSATTSRIRGMSTLKVNTSTRTWNWRARLPKWHATPQPGSTHYAPRLLMMMTGRDIRTALTNIGNRMLRVCRRRACLAAVLIVALMEVGSPADEKGKAAAEAAAQWLLLVDSGQYGESWFQASTDFRGAASKEQWIHALNTVRLPLGKLLL